MFSQQMLKDKLFLFPLIIKIIFILSIVPYASENWYIPFLENSLVNFSIDPWSTYLIQNEGNYSFPYGYIMWIMFLPLMLISSLFDFPIFLAYGFTLLFFDICLLWLLSQFMEVSKRTLYLLYWCSPIVIFATYWQGLNDIIPVSLLCFSLLFLRKRQTILSGFLLGAAISAKLSMIVTLPFIIFYLWRNRSNNIMLLPFSKGLCISTILFIIPFLFSNSAMNMLQNNIEIRKIYDLSILLGGGEEVYILGVSYFLILYLVWKIGRFNFSMLMAILSTSFFLILLMTPAAPGWFVWVTPFLVYLQVQCGRRIIYLVSVFSISYIIVASFNTPFPNSNFLLIEHLSEINLSKHIQNILLTMLTSFGIVLCWRVWRESLRKNDEFGLSRRPVVIGIAGNSGAGKDTLVDNLTLLFGHHSVVSLSGDDYHFWDRHKPMWQVMTHLNPQANDLEKFATDVTELSHRRSIISRHYDHKEGLKGKPYKLSPKDFVMVSGLHALYLPILRDKYDVSIFLDIDENLRRYFKLKRDVTQRNQLKEAVISSIERREPDAKSFIDPQYIHADLVLSLQPIHLHFLEDLESEREIRTRLQVKTLRGSLEMQVRRQLVGICGLHVDLDLSSNEKYVVMTIEGDVWAEDIALAAHQLLPNISDVLDIEPIWIGGMGGLMQLFVLVHLYQARVANKNI